MCIIDTSCWFTLQITYLCAMCNLFSSLVLGEFLLSSSKETQRSALPTAVEGYIICKLLKTRSFNSLVFSALMNDSVQ